MGDKNQVTDFLHHCHENNNDTCKLVPQHPRIKAGDHNERSEVMFGPRTHSGFQMTGFNEAQDESASHRHRYSYLRPVAHL